ncbi:MAG: nucleoside hydrolase [Oenococcus sp.]|uniref:nucleoside hydrolase n=1 Tax=Oenococcus TaxID=46254 RepID=UPI0021E7DB53|nr:nucleoside hydrolase [Oenococcus kitaharae]MCV3296632.1 nucleoside hydrolase [Oenococcus kitaharae]
MQSIKHILIDTDPGVDDALALALAFMNEGLRIDLLTTVHGNISLAQSTENALKLLSFWGKHIPVAAGAAVPLTGKTVTALSVHGPNGLGGLELPDPTCSVIEIDAVTAMDRVLKKADQPMTIVAIAPLTNIARLLQQHPEDREKISNLVIMGGAWGRGNAGVLSEFNIFNDPQAAEIVFNQGLTLTVLPLEIGRQAQIKKTILPTIAASGRVGRSIADMLAGYRSGSKDAFNIYDALTMAYLAHPEYFTLVPAFVAIETSGRYTRGASLIDDRGKLKQSANAKVAKSIDSVAFSHWFEQQWQ